MKFCFSINILTVHYNLMSIYLLVLCNSLIPLDRRIAVHLLVLFDRLVALNGRIAIYGRSVINSLAVSYLLASHYCLAISYSLTAVNLRISRINRII